MCFDALLPRRTPWYPFNQARSRGTALQSMTEQRSSQPLSPTSPLAISLVAIADFSAHLLPLPPRNWPSTRMCSSDRPRRTYPSRLTGMDAFTTHEALLRSATSLQGFNPSADWGIARWISPRGDTLALLGFSSLGRSPSRALASPIDARSSQLSHRPRSGKPKRSRAQAPGLRSASSQALQENTRSGSCSLCFRVSKNSGSRLASPEAAGP
jgi:hypothetical protein